MRWEKRKFTKDESRRSAGSLSAAVCSTWRLPVSVTELPVSRAAAFVDCCETITSAEFYTDIVVHCQHITMQFEDGEETKSDFLARMILEGRIDYDAEKK